MAKNDDRLSKLRERMSKEKSGGGSEYWKPPVGKSTIRIMPETGNMEYFFQIVGTHNIKKGKDNKSLICPLVTSDGALPCPICEHSSKLYQQGDKDTASKYRPRKSYRMNIVVRGKDGEEDRGPVVYTPGIKVFEELFGMVDDPEYGDITSITDGWDITLEREGEGLDTDYKLRSRARRSPLSEDEELIEKWLKECKDLSSILDNLPTSEELMVESGLNRIYGMEEDEDAEPDETPRRRVRKVVDEEEEEEYDL